jgi:SAM-dependent methyltransferase
VPPQWLFGCGLARLGKRRADSEIGSNSKSRGGHDEPMDESVGPALHPSIAGRYGTGIEQDRLTDENLLEWLRTTDILGRHLPVTGHVLDVGGGPGAYAAWLAECGYDVDLIDPVPLHIEQARFRAVTGTHFGVHSGDPRQLPFPNACADIVLLMGPLYHLVDAADRATALDEARRTLRPGGVLVAVAIGRYGWFTDAVVRDLIVDPAVLRSVKRSVATGMSTADPGPESFYAYFHHPDELTQEVVDAGFSDVAVFAVEGVASLLVDVRQRLQRPESAAALLALLARHEREPAMLAISSHILAVATLDHPETPNNRRPAPD